MFNHSHSPLKFVLLMLFAFACPLFAESDLKDLAEAFPKEKLLNKYQKDNYQSHRFETAKSFEFLEKKLKEFLGESWKVGRETPQEKAARERREKETDALFKGLPKPVILGRQFYVNKKFPDLKIYITLNKSIFEGQANTLMVSAVPKKKQ